MKIKDVCEFELSLKDKELETPEVKAWLKECVDKIKEGEIEGYYEAIEDMLIYGRSMSNVVCEDGKVIFKRVYEEDKNK